VKRGRIHVIGGGMAGLAAAVALAARGETVSLHEAAAQAGGRCRSYFDPQLGRVIDNGNHLVLAGNHCVASYIAAIGAMDRISGPATADFAYVDLGDGARWQLRPSAGRLPWWLFDASRRVPGTGPADYLQLARLLRRNPGRTLAEVITARGPLWHRLLESYFVSALNTRPEEASADLAGAIVRGTLAAGGDASRPRIALPTLAAAFVDPALVMLGNHGADIRLRHRLRGIEFAGHRASALDFGAETVALGVDDRVVLAVPPWMAAEILPETTVPDRFHAIVNGHFAIAPPAGAPLMLGVIGGTVEWIFSFPDRISVTVSCADTLAELDRESLAVRLWADVVQALDVPKELPSWQIVKEMRATFAATPEQDARRPAAATRWQNLWLAGDWTQTGLPATIEGAVQSGQHAAVLASAARLA
jgi:squalene-associated FAD-dependent desaturase